MQLFQMAKVCKQLQNLHEINMAYMVYNSILHIILLAFKVFHKKYKECKYDTK